MHWLGWMKGRSMVSYSVPKASSPGTDGSWIHFDYVPGEQNIRRGPAGITGRLCVIGSELKEHDLDHLFCLD